MVNWAGIEKDARYYAKAARASDLKFGKLMSDAQARAYAAEKWDDNYGGSEGRGHFVQVLLNTYFYPGKKSSKPQRQAVSRKPKRKASAKAKPKTITARALQQACKSRHLPAFLRKLCK